MPLTCGRRRSDVTIALLRSRAPAAPPAMPPPCDDRRRDEAEHLPRPARCADHPCAARSRAGCCSGRLPDRRGRAPHPAGHAHDGSEHGRAAQRHGTHGGLLVRPGVMARAGHAAVLRGGRVRLGDLVVAPVRGGRPRAGLGARPAAAPGRAGERCVGRPGAGRRPRDARGDARRLGLDGAAGARDAPVVRGRLHRVPGRCAAAARAARSPARSHPGCAGGAQRCDRGAAHRRGAAVVGPARLRPGLAGGPSDRLLPPRRILRSCLGRKTARDHGPVGPGDALPDEPALVGCGRTVGPEPAHAVHDRPRRGSGLRPAVVLAGSRAAHAMASRAGRRLGRRLAGHDPVPVAPAGDRGRDGGVGAARRPGSGARLGAVVAVAPADRAAVLGDGPAGRASAGRPGGRGGADRRPRARTGGARSRRIALG